MRWLLITVFLAVLGVACGSSSDSEVTRVVDVTKVIEVTQVVEVTKVIEVTQIIEVTKVIEATKVIDDKEVIPLEDGTTTTPSGLQIKELVAGTGEAATAGKIAVVHYTGWLLDGTKFDSSVDRGTPFEFALGQGRVIKGWDEGVATMKVGGKVELIIPPDLAYGAQGAGGVIPSNATLKFEVELLELK